MKFGLPLLSQYILIPCFPPPVNCGVPITPVNGSIENIHGISTVGGTQIIFRCNECFVPAGRMSATCISSSGRWAPNPADLVCNGEPQKGTKTPLMMVSVSNTEWMCGVVNQYIICMFLYLGYMNIY